MDSLSTGSLVLRLVESMSRAIRGVFRKRKSRIERAILGHLATRADFLGPGQISNDVFRLKVIQDVPLSVALASSTKAAKGFLFRLRTLGIEIRHRWRMWWDFVPERRVRAVMLEMWSEGLLVKNDREERYQMSPQVASRGVDALPSANWWLEFFKAITGPSALVALVLTYWTSTQQFAHLARTRNQDRFDRAVSWLGSSNPTERLGGVSGLQLFLDTAANVSGISDPSEALERQRAALLFLVNAVAVEKDTTVQGAILDNMSALAKYKIKREVLDDTLAVARDRNRVILSAFQARFQELSEENQKLLVDQVSDEAWLGKLSESDLLPLKGTAATIAALVRNGARVSDLSKVYCVACDFSGEGVDLSEVKFDSSYLRNAKFLGVHLEGASFNGAFLSHTDFTGADLRRAKLTEPPLLNAPVQSILAKKALYGTYGPIFECADLTDSDFTGSVLFGFYWTRVNGAGYFPRFYGADLTRANLRSFVVFSAVPKRVIVGNQRGSGMAAYELFGPEPGASYSSYSHGQFRIKGWDEKDYLISVQSLGEHFGFNKTIPKAMWPSVFAAINSLASAKNLEEAHLPEKLRQFIRANPTAFSKPIISTTCSGHP